MRVSADTKTCGPPLNPSPTVVYRLPTGKHYDILTEYQTIVKKKMTKKRTFFALLHEVDSLAIFW
jgi:hypothetical protein